MLQETISFENNEVQNCTYFTSQGQHISMSLKNLVWNQDNFLPMLPSSLWICTMQKLTFGEYVDVEKNGDRCYYVSVSTQFFRESFRLCYYESNSSINFSCKSHFWFSGIFCTIIFVGIFSAGSRSTLLCFERQQNISVTSA